MGIGIASSSLVDLAHTRHVSENGADTIETPTRRDYWFGHGYRIHGALERERFERLRALGVRRFGAIEDVRRFTIVCEVERELTDVAAVFGDETVESTDVLVFDSSRTPVLDSSIVALSDDDRWLDVEAVAAAADHPQHADFNRWVLQNHRDAVRTGRAAFFGAVVDNRIVAYAGAYYGRDFARFVTPNTLERYRGRGLFGSCARHCLAEAARRKVARVVIVASSDGYQRRIYGRLGASFSGRQYAVVIDPHARAAADER